MDVALLVARVVLGLVFAVAGLAKLLDREGSRRAAAGFGVPEQLAGPVALGLPLAELALAGLLLPAATAVWAALAALALLLVFCAAIGVNMARGRAPDCHCFGALHSEPAGWRTLGRNAVLAAGAASVAVAGRTDPGPSGVAWIGRLEGPGALAVAALGVALTILAGAVWFGGQLLSAHGRLLVRVDELEAALAGDGRPLHAPMPAGLPVGAAAPEFELDHLAGDRVGLDGLLEPGLPLALVFTDPGCGPCETLMPAVAELQQTRAETLTIAVVSGAAADATRPKAEEHGLRLVLLDPERELSARYDATGTPSAVLLAPDGTIASPVAGGGDAVSRLLEEAGSEPEAGSPLGAELPDHELRSLDGELVSVRGAGGHERLLLFWNAECGFCRAMRDDLRAWEDAPPAGAPELVVVSSSDMEATAAEGFAGRVLLDPGFAVGAELRAPGTPSAVLVDAAGRVAAPLAVGPDEVLALAGGAPARRRSAETV